MAMHENLTPFKEGEERTKIAGHNGGVKSGEVRREKATMRQTLQLLLETENKKGTSYKELTTLGLIKGAIDGKAENYKLILTLLGELEEKSQETPVVNINVVDNSNLEKIMYETNREEGN